jgi:hypothetical protein
MQISFCYSCKILKKGDTIVVNEAVDMLAHFDRQLCIAVCAVSFVLGYYKHRQFSDCIMDQALTV